MNSARDTQAGFTLIETLVALAVLAVGSVTLLIGVERHAAGVRGLSDRVVARWVAENTITATMLELEQQPQWSTALGVEWDIIQTTRPLPGSGLRSVTVRVADAASDRDGSLVVLTGYVSSPEAAQ